MPDEIDNSDAIEDLDEILNTGASSVTVDGVTTSFDHDSIRKRKNELLAEQTPSRRPRVSTINLGKSF